MKYLLLIMMLIGFSTQAQDNPNRPNLPITNYHSLFENYAWGADTVQVAGGGEVNNIKYYFYLTDPTQNGDFQITGFHVSSNLRVPSIFMGEMLIASMGSKYYPDQEHYYARTRLMPGMHFVYTATSSGSGATVPAITIMTKNFTMSLDPPEEYFNQN